MKNETIDYINIGLIILAFVIAVFLPFELFLFSYAFLGPLHYLTEINWLDDKNYFLKSRNQVYRVFIMIACSVAAFPFLRYIDNDFIQLLSSKKSIIFFTLFVFSVGLLFITKLKQLFVVFLGSIIIGLVCFLLVPKIVIAMGMFLPTLLHVYVFTLLFMIYGMLKSYSKAGIISVVLLIAVPVVLIFIDIVPSTYKISKFTEDTFIKSGFLSLNTTVAGLIEEIDKSKIALTTSVIVKVQVFIAFAYTYHYLNWFSKTSIIGWKKSITTTRMKYIIGIWLFSVGIYLYDYSTGLFVLFFLSLLHVFLEFPLNAVTIREVLKALARVKN
ncbi:MAG: hypothetical protein HRU50_14210 [Winogradskyella sp.]|uniref:hypothetical protein n=1 Tax=Winogradskyella sp. TaxID=1883156 RepID=UPI0025FCB54D|nr:hypothetical protein [Winogradskyella sp.]NRB61081.1 hypothetical protein [Winogradskyella sp.]